MFQPSTGKSAPRWAKPRNFILALGVVLVVAAAVLISLQRYSERQYRLALSTDELGIAAYELSSVGMRVVMTHQRPAGALPATPQEIVDARLDLARAINHFRTDALLTQDVPLLAKVEEFAATMRALLIAIQDQNYAAIPSIQAQSNAQFEPLTQNIRDSSRYYANRAGEVQTLALIGRSFVVIFAGIVIAFLYWRYRIVQRQADRAEAEQEVLRHNEARFRPLVQSSSDTIAVINADNVVTYVSPAVERITGLTPEQITGKSVLEPVALEDRRAFEMFLSVVHRRPNRVAHRELEFTSPSGSRHLEVVCTNRLQDPDVRGLVLNIRDVTERKTLEHQLRFQAFHDALTGLANGALFAERLEQGLQRVNKLGRGQVGVIYLDLDHFKDVNDDLGHKAGDDLLREVGQRLLASIRSSDLAARLGGDEFAVLIEDSAAVSKVRDVADRILKALASPFVVEGRQVSVSASIGVVVTDAATMSAGDVLRNADIAMYDAKHHGRNRVHHFQPGMVRALEELDVDSAPETPARTAA